MNLRLPHVLALIPGALMGLNADPMSQIGLLRAAETTESEEHRLVIQDARPNISAATLLGPRFSAPKWFHSFEDGNSPLVRRLREEYSLPEIIGNEPSEFRQTVDQGSFVVRRMRSVADRFRIAVTRTA